MKKLFVIVLVVCVVAAAGFGIYMYQKSRSPNIVSPEGGQEAVSPTPVPQRLALWEDPAGFTFQYPEDVSVNKHDEDQVNYAHIEMTHKDHPGSIIVWAKDTTAADSATWVKGEKFLSGGTVFDTSLGDLSGKKVLIATPKKSVVTGIVDEGVVFYVEGVFESSEYWTKAYDSITTSFAFSGDQQAASAPAAAGGEESVDEEEIIE